MPALTETEATARAALLDVASYDVFADLTAEPVRSRTEIRFGCREPGAATFAELIATTTLSLVLPAGWDCLTNGPVTERPPAGQAGTWRFGPVSGTRPFDLTIAAGPYVEDWRGQGGA